MPRLPISFPSRASRHNKYHPPLATLPLSPAPSCFPQRAVRVRVLGGVFSNVTNAGELDASGVSCDIMRHITNGYSPGEGSMSVRKRKWVTSRGESREAFIVDFVDQEGNRHIRTFDRK